MRVVVSLDLLMSFSNLVGQSVTSTNKFSFVQERVKVASLADHLSLGVPFLFVKTTIETKKHSVSSSELNAK